MRVLLKDLQALAKASGLSWSIARLCIVKTDGDFVEIDERHPVYPDSHRHRRPEEVLKLLGGPGTELSKLLKRLGINPTPTCKCRAKAEEMNAWGPDECEKPERIEEVVAVMREEAEARGLPFLDAAGRLLVKRAIRNARKAAS
jgi:hypothetical protein